MKAILILPALCLCALLSAPVTAQMIIRVDGDNGAAVPPNADGEDWGASAYKYLRDAIARAESVLGGEDPPSAVHIWVKGNTQSPYLPHQSELGHLTGQAALEASFVLSDGIFIFGGFAGTEDEEEFNLRDHTSNVTILCGDLNQDDDDPQTGFLEEGLPAFVWVDRAVDDARAGGADAPPATPLRAGGLSWSAGARVVVASRIAFRGARRGPLALTARPIWRVRRGASAFDDSRARALPPSSHRRGGCRGALQPPCARASGKREHSRRNALVHRQGH
ncbi:MAG: hypothetical protein KF817_04750 [Phycisphaeraceae bacterium]|nr:hypothetical protein [Phycisphaeraceae bacterium]